MLNLGIRGDALFGEFGLLQIRKEFNSRGGHRHCDEHAKETAELPANNQGEDWDHGRHAHHLAHHQGVDDVILKLLDEEVEGTHNKSGRQIKRSIGNENGGEGRENGAEERDEFKDARQDREEECVRHANDDESQVDQDHDENAEHELALHPKAHLGLRALPEIDHVILMLDGSNDPQEFSDTIFLYREVEGEHDNQDETHYTAGNQGETVENALREKLGEGVEISARVFDEAARLEAGEDVLGLKHPRENALIDHRIGVDGKCLDEARDLADQGQEQEVEEAHEAERCQDVEAQDRY